MEKLENIIKRIEKEPDFLKLVEIFAEGAAIVKEEMGKSVAARGQLLELVRDVDGYIEKVLKIGGGADVGGGNA